MSLEGGVRMGVVGVDVAPVHDGADARFGRPEQADQGCGVQIIGRVVGGVTVGRACDPGNVPETPEQRFPYMSMGVHEPGHDDRVGGIDHRGITRPQ